MSWAAGMPPALNKGAQQDLPIGAEAVMAASDFLLFALGMSRRRQDPAFDARFETRELGMAKKLPFSVGDYVVYPTHGVGRVVDVATEEISGYELRLFVINFAVEKMTLRVPVDKAEESGLRKISTREKMETAMTKLRGRARAKRTMWSRRAQEYEAKINSGDPVAIAEVVRDLHRNPDQPDQSYSERQMYEAALNRFSNELALVEKIEPGAAAERVESLLLKVA